jgi:glucose-6-phosphate dehydrogenase assembly protein OpcA
MTRARTPPMPPAPVALKDVERELTRRLRLTHGPGESPVIRACMSNLIIYCHTAELAERIAADVPAIIAFHPARVLLLIADQGAPPDLTAYVSVRGHVVEPGRWVVSEQITLRAGGTALDRLPYAVRGLLIGDLPINLWWAPPLPPTLGGALLYELSERAQQVVYDSIGWTEPAQGVVATAGWLSSFERDGVEGGPWRVASDLNWRRLKYWRRLLGQALDPKSAPGALESISEVLVEHGPHAVVQAWELVSWMASRLDWKVQAGRVQPGVEITWQVKAPHGTLTVRIRRLSEGRSEVRRVRIGCLLDGKPGALNTVVEDERRLAIMPEGVPGAARTVTVQPQGIAELLARQLSDRERDAVFRQSMEVAQIFAKTVLG